MPAEQKAIVEIRLAEEKRAQNLSKDGRLEIWVKELRKKYIADGFLMPFYAWDGRYSRSRQRIDKLGSYILPCEKAGEVFHPGPPAGWILQEDTWFWAYLVQGQEAIFMQPMSSLPDTLRIDGMPGGQVWNLIVIFARQTGLFGENGGGLVFTANDLEEIYLAKIAQQKIRYERENGEDIEPQQIVEQLHWITLFRQYGEVEYSKYQLELRPGWFHLANYAIYNTPLTRLPVFLGVFEKGKISGIRFLEDTLSDEARDFIGKVLLKMPIEAKKQLDIDNLVREKKEMAWWLWHNVGHRERNKTLSYREIADIAHIQRSSIQTAVGRFDRKLRNKLDGKLLERLLRTSQSLGLGYNITYQALVERGLVPSREREIDAFDELDKLL